MGRFQLTRQNDNAGAITTLAAQLAETVADALDEAGVPLTVTNTIALTCALNKALERVGCERERAVRQGRIERRAAWVREQGLLKAGEAADRLGLTLHELETARILGLIAPVEIPPHLRAVSDHFTPESWRYYRPDITLTEASRATITHETLLTRLQAAERLGVPTLTFDQLRREHGVAAVEQVQEQGGTRLNRYRADAVDHLMTVMNAAPPDMPRR